MTVQNQDFNPTGAVINWTAPDYILHDSLTIKAAGGAGGPGQGAGHPGGAGGVCHAGFDCNPGDVFQIYVGQEGQIPGGGFGYVTGGDGGTSDTSNGGGGGGSSAVYNTTSSALYIVAGGGGGAGSGGYGKNVYGLWYSQGGIGGQTPGEGMPGYNGGGTAGGQGTPSGPGAAGGGAASSGGSASSGVAGVGGDGDPSGGSGGGGGGGYDVNNGNGGGGGGNGGGGSAPDGGGGGSGGTSFLAGTTAHQYFDDGGNAEGSDILGNPTGDGYVNLSWTECDPPNAPTVYSPSPSASVDIWNDGLTVEWEYEPGTDSGDQSAYALRVSALGQPLQWWNGSAMQDDIVWVTSTDQTVTIPASIVPNNGAMIVAVRTQEATYSLEGPASTDVLIITPDAPSLVFVSPSGPTQLLPPLVNWTDNFNGDGESQTAFQMRLFDSATVALDSFDPGSTTALEDSGVTSSSATEYQSAYGSYATGTTYYAFVQITQTDGSTSEWTPTLFTAEDTIPNNPALVILDTDGTGEHPVILVSGSDINDLPGNTSVTVSHTTDFGASWTEVATVSLPADSQLAAIEDEAIVVGEMWRAVITVPVNGVTSDTVQTSSVVVWSPTAATLSDPSVEHSIMPVGISKFPASQRPIAQAVFSGIGSIEDTVISDVRRLREGQITLLTDNNAQRDVLLAMLSTPRPLLLQRPPNDPAAPGEYLVFVITGSITEDKPTTINRNVPWRTLQFSYAEQS